MSEHTLNDTGRLDWLEDLGSNLEKVSKVAMEGAKYHNIRGAIDGQIVADEARRARNKDTRDKMMLEEKQKMAIEDRKVRLSKGDLSSILS